MYFHCYFEFGMLNMCEIVIFELKNGCSRGSMLNLLVWESLPKKNIVLGGDLFGSRWYQGPVRMLPTFRHQEARLPPSWRNWWGYEVRKLNRQIKWICEERYFFATLNADDAQTAVIGTIIICPKSDLE